LARKLWTMQQPFGIAITGHREPRTGNREPGTAMFTFRLQFPPACGSARSSRHSRRS
jgi:hypothetical protein